MHPVHLFSTDLEGWNIDQAELVRPLRGLFLLMSGHEHGDLAARWITQVLTADQYLEVLLVLKDVVDQPDMAPGPPEEPKPTSLLGPAGGSVTAAATAGGSE